MNVEQLTQASRDTKAIADRILSESGLLKMLEPHGEVKLVGSYALDVMLRPDIDVYVVAPEHRWEDVRTLMGGLMERRYFNEIGFLNWIDFPNEGHTDLKGYYFQPCRWVDGVFWKVDLWLTTPEYDRDSEHTQKYAQLLAQHPGKRALILAIKYALRHGSKYEKGVDGQRIYGAVLEQGVTSVEEFVRKLETTP